MSTSNDIRPLSMPRSSSASQSASQQSQNQFNKQNSFTQLISPGNVRSSAVMSPTSAISEEGEGESMNRLTNESANPKDNHAINPNHVAVHIDEGEEAVQADQPEETQSNNRLSSHDGQNIVYISDVSEIPRETDARLLELSNRCAPGRVCTSCTVQQPEDGEKGWPIFDQPHTNDSGIHLLVIDSLFVDRKNPNHLSLPEAIDCIRRYRPHHALLTGMSDDHEFLTVNKQLESLRSQGLHVRMAYDGQRLNINL